MVSPINSGITYAMITPQSLFSFQMSFLGDRFKIIYLNICLSSLSKSPKLSGPWGRSYLLTPVYIEYKHHFSSVAQSCPTLWPHGLQHYQASLSITNFWSLPKLMSIGSVMPFHHLILCHSRPLLPSIFPSIRVLSNKSVLRIKWPKYWSFSFSISPSNEYSGLIS